MTEQLPTVPAHRPVRSVARLALGLAALLLPGLGCASSRSHLTLTSQQDSQIYRQRFAHAYASPGPAGSCDVVLVDDAAVAVNDAPAAVQSLRQIMHIRVMYQPMKGTKADHPSATNASIHWYVFGADPKGATDVLEYSGAGFVILDQGARFATLEIRNATLKPTARHGDMTDPIGPARLSGTLVARTDTQRVKDLLAEARSGAVLAAATEDAVSARSEDRPVGP